jgi:hypothetical protein
VLRQESDSHPGDTVAPTSRSLEDWNAERMQGS